MSKMLGQDIVTQEEFDVFLQTKFNKLQAQSELDNKLLLERQAENEKALRKSTLTAVVSMVISVVSIVGMLVIIIL